MRLYTKQHPYCCGIDLHTRTMCVCILDQAGEPLPDSWGAATGDVPRRVYQHQLDASRG
jgi:hypothetical protein